MLHSGAEKQSYEEATMALLINYGVTAQEEPAHTLALPAGPSSTKMVSRMPITASTSFTLISSGGRKRTDCEPQRRMSRFFS